MTEPLVIQAVALRAQGFTIRQIQPHLRITEGKNRKIQLFAATQATIPRRSRPTTKQRREHGDRADSAPLAAHPDGRLWDPTATPLVRRRSHHPEVRQMGQQIIKQPDGKLAVFSSVTDSFIRRHATSEELVEWRAAEAADAARERTRAELKKVLAGTRAPPTTSSP